MVTPANPLPPGCPAGWPIKLTAHSGIQIVWGPPHSRQSPGWKQLRGIGIKMRLTHVPGYPEHSESWAGLYEQKLHELYFRFRIAMPDRQPYEMVLHLPMMGMPPREPSEELMQQARTAQRFTSFFRYATVVKADVFETTLFQGVHINQTRGHGNTIGDDVVIKLPIWPKAPETSLYRATEKAHGFEFRTHLPQHDTDHGHSNVKLGNLYFIQLLPNELPSYHFWAGPNDKPLPAARKRDILDGAGCPHYADVGASFKQKIRKSPKTSPTKSGQSQPSPELVAKSPRSPKDADASGRP